MAGPYRIYRSVMKGDRRAAEIHMFTTVSDEDRVLMSFPGLVFSGAPTLRVESDRTVVFDKCLPETVCAAAVGRQGWELIDHPIFAKGTRAGDAIVKSIKHTEEMYRFNIRDVGDEGERIQLQAVTFDRYIVPDPDFDLFNPDDTPLGQDDQSWRDLTDDDIEAIRRA